jgi:hypothetical protein
MTRFLAGTLATFAFAVGVVAAPARSAPSASQNYGPNDFLWDPCCLSARYTKVVVATVNRIHKTVPGCEQLDTSSVAYTDTRPAKVKRIFVWCSDDPPGMQSFKVIFDTTGRIVRKER